MCGRPLSADCLAIACRATVRSCCEFMGSDHANCVLSHQTPNSTVPNSTVPNSTVPDTTVPDTQAQFVQLFRHSGATITALAQSVLPLGHVNMPCRPTDCGYAPKPRAFIRTNGIHALDMSRRCRWDTGPLSRFAGKPLPGNGCFQARRPRSVTPITLQACARESPPR
jgi:hypothetical protein